LIARDVARCGNGLIFDEVSVDAIVQAIHQAKAELPRLRANAASCVAAFRKQHGADHYIDAIEALFRARTS
jgi:hypothetical protein